MTNSFFLFGARGTGKSTYLQSHVDASRALWIDLLDPEVEDIYSRRPNLLESKLDALDRAPEWVVIDEVQKVPKLLNLAHKLIEKRGQKFILTGSSARKLKRGAANLLAGRAFVNHLYPLTQEELGNDFSLDFVLRWGSLPRVFQLASEVERTAYLKSYALTYVKEEVQTEQLLRSLDPFREFLPIAAQSNGHILNSSRIAREIGVDVKTVQKYFQILEETLIGFHLPAYSRSIRKNQRSHPKFYFFDPGVKKALEQSLDLAPRSGTAEFGHAFEHWIVLEILRHNAYTGKDFRMSYLQTKDNVEIDLVLSKPGRPPIAIEIKSTQKVDDIEVRKLERLAIDLPEAEILYLSRDPNRQKLGQVLCLPWQDGLKRIFGLKT